MHYFATVRRRMAQFAAKRSSQNGHSLPSNAKICVSGLVARLFKRRTRDLYVARDLGHALFWPVLHFFLFRIRSLNLNQRAKFEFCIFTRFSDIKGPKIRKVGHVT